MTSDLEELLREGIDRLTTGASAPTGLIRRAQQRNRQRRIVIRTATATSTAIVAAVATVIAISLSSSGTRPGRTPLHSQTVADVVTRTERALAVAADQGRAIQEVLSSGRNETFGLTVINMALTFEKNPTGSAVVPQVLSTVTAQRRVTWSYRGLQLDEGFSAAGQLVFHTSINNITLRSGKQVQEVYGAAYPARTRWHTILRGLSGPLPRLTCQRAVVPSAYPSWHATISKALSCGLFYLSGRQQVDGVDALTLISKPQNGLPVRETIWVDPSTYLPVRTSFTFLAAHGQGSELVYDYRWLQPSRANLAQLHAAISRATIPAGFRKLPAKYLPVAGARENRD